MENQHLKFTLNSYFVVYSRAKEQMFNEQKIISKALSIKNQYRLFSYQIFYLFSNELKNSTAKFFYFTKLCKNSEML